METMEDMAAIFKRFGDEQSTLLDQYERLSFEVQLNKAMLGRSLSEAAVPRQPPPPKLVGKPVRRGRGSGFQRVMRKLFGPILGNKAASKDGGPNSKDPMFSKTFSKSLRA